MPWTPILRLEEQRLAQSKAAGRLGGDREQLIGLINASQQCLGELLRRLHAARQPGRDPEGPAQSDLPPEEAARAEQAIAATLGRLGELVPSPPIAPVRREDLDAVRVATAELSARLTRLDGGIEERMLRTADLAARGAEIAMQERLKALRGEIDGVRRSVAEATTELRGVLARQDAARGSDLGAVRTAVDGVRADLVRLDATLDGRILSKVDTAWRTVDVELSRLRARIESIAASSSAGAWSMLGKALCDPIGALTAVTAFVLGGWLTDRPT